MFLGPIDGSRGLAATGTHRTLLPLRTEMPSNRHSAAGGLRLARPSGRSVADQERAVMAIHGVDCVGQGDEWAKRVMLGCHQQVHPFDACDPDG